MAEIIREVVEHHIITTDYVKGVIYYAQIKVEMYSYQIFYNCFQLSAKCRQPSQNELVQFEWQWPRSQEVS